MPIRQITIVGTGLVGGSLGLALKKHGFRGTIIGCDREQVLVTAKRLRAIDAGVLDPGKAVVLARVRQPGLVHLLGKPLSAVQTGLCERRLSPIILRSLNACCVDGLVLCCGRHWV